MKKKILEKRGKVFYRFLLSYLVILLFPLFLSLFVYGQSRDLLAGEVEKANGLLLNQLKVYCDAMISSSLSISSLIAENTRIEGLIYQEPPMTSEIRFKAYNIVNDFSDYKLANKNVISFFIYIDALDLVISPFGYFSSYSYYHNYLQKISRSYEDWLDTLRSVRGRVFLPFQTTDPGNTLIDTIGLFSPVPTFSRRGTPRAVSVVELDQTLFKELMKETSWTERSILAIYDRGRNILLSSREDVDLGGIDLDGDFRGGSGYIDSVVIGEQTYAVLLTRSDEVDWSYVSLVPLDIYNDLFDKLLRLTIIFLLFSAFAGSGLVYLTAKSRYKPVYELLNLIRPREGSVMTISSDEFNIISRGIRRTMEEGSKLKREIGESLPLVRQRELKSLLKNGRMNWEDREEQFGRLDIAFPHPVFFCVLIDKGEQDDFPLSNGDTWEERLREVGHVRIFVVNDVDGFVGLIVNGKEESYRPFLEELSRLRDEFERELSFTCAMGISSRGRAQEDLPRLYAESRRALEYRLVKGRSRPILYDDICLATHHYYYSLEEETSFIAAIRTGEEQRAFEILEGVITLNFTQDRLISVEMARCLMNDLIASLIKALEKMIAKEEENVFWHNLRALERLTACQSFEVLKEEMEDILYQVCVHIRKEKEIQSSDLKDRIVAYVEEHYAEPGLCVESIADSLKRNAAYLSRYFKEQTSGGLSLYIRRYRVARAKEMLMKGDEKIGEIAESAGFSNANALIRAFKEVEGMTPGQYRENRYV